MKKIEFKIGNPETGSKKTDVNSITNSDKIADMNNNKRDYRSHNPTNNVYSNIDHKNVQQEWTIHISLYHLADSKLQLNYNIEESYRTNDWKSTNSHNCEPVIVYNDKVGNKALHSRVLYALYIIPNDIGNRHLIYKLSTGQILIMKDYQPVPVYNDLIEAMNKKIHMVTRSKSYISRTATQQFKMIILANTMRSVIIILMIQMIMKIRIKMNQIVHYN